MGGCCGIYTDAHVHQASQLKVGDVITFSGDTQTAKVMSIIYPFMQNPPAHRPHQLKMTVEIGQYIETGTIDNGHLTLEREIGKGWGIQNHWRNVLP